MKKIGIIGYGNMGQAIAHKINTKYKVIVFDKDSLKIANIQKEEKAEGIADLLAKADALILAVKPQDFDIVLNEIKKHLFSKLIISIAAGISTNYIESKLVKARLIRAMPNIGARIGESDTCLCRGKFASEEDFILSKDIFDYIGKTWEIKESLMDAATAICGSGPAYIYHDMEKNNINPLNISEEQKNNYVRKLEDAAKAVGFDAKIAQEFSTSSVTSTINLGKQAGISVRELREMVTSKGGTTEAAIIVLEKGGSWKDAALAALKRAGELSKKE